MDGHGIALRLTKIRDKHIIHISQTNNILLTTLLQIKYFIIMAAGLFSTMGR